MPELTLQLLGHGMDVAEAALQRMVFEDRRGTRRIVSEIDRFARFVDGVGRRHANGDALRDRDGGAGRKILPGVSHRLQHESARGAQIDFGLSQVGLHHGVLAQWALAAARHLVAGQIDKTVERAAGNTAGDAGKADLIASAGAHAIQRAALAALLVEFAGDRMVRSDEEIIKCELIAGRAPQTDRVPDVGPRYVLRAYQHGAFLLLTIGAQPGRAAGLKDWTMGAKPGRVAAAGGKGPHAGDLVAAFALDRPDLGTGAPGQHRAWVVAE